MLNTNYISMAKAAQLIPGRPNASTVWRWANQGVRGVKLRSVRSGNKILTTPQWVEEFNDKCNQEATDRAETELINDGC